MRQQVMQLRDKLAMEAGARREAQRRLLVQRHEAERKHARLRAAYDVRLRELQGQVSAQAEVEQTSLAYNSAADLANLRKEREEQELLIAALGKENELAVERIRNMQFEHRRQLEAAAAEARDLRIALTEVQVADHRRPPQTPAADAARLQEMLGLQAQLHGAREQAAEQVAELRARAECAEAAKVDLEAQVSRLELALQDGDSRLAETVAAAQQDAQLVQTQAAMILQLERALLEADKLAAARAEAEQAAQAAGSEAPSASLDELRGKLAHLQEALTARDSEAARKLRMLTKEHDRLRVAHASRAAAAKAACARVAELEQQVEEMRAAHSKQVRALEAQMREAVGPGKLPGSCSISQPVLPRRMAKPQVQVQMQVRRQQQQEATTDHQQHAQWLQAEVEALQKRLAVADQQINGMAEREAAAVAKDQHLQDTIASLEAEREALRAELEGTGDWRQQAAEAEGLRAELMRAREQVREAKAALDDAERTRAEAAAALTAARADAKASYAQHTAALEVAHAAAAEGRAQLAVAERRARDCQHELSELRGQLRDARMHLPWAPSAVEYAALERRLEELQKQYLSAEARFLRMAEESRVAAAEREVAMRQHYEATLRGTVVQVDAFKRELDSLLVAARALQAPGSRR